MERRTFLEHLITAPLIFSQKSCDQPGKTIQTENAEINNGTLQKTVNASSVLANGLYMIRIIVNDKIYKTELMYAK